MNRHNLTRYIFLLLFFVLIIISIFGYFWMTSFSEPQKYDQNINVDISIFRDSNSIQIMLLEDLSDPRPYFIRIEKNETNYISIMNISLIGEKGSLINININDSFLEKNDIVTLMIFIVPSPEEHPSGVLVWSEKIKSK